MEKSIQNHESKMNEDSKASTRKPKIPEIKEDHE